MSGALTLDEQIEALEDQLATLKRIRDRRSADRRDWIDQSQSALGPRRHCSAVKHRIAAREQGAAIVGRRHLLSPDALEAEIVAMSGRSPKKTKPETPTEALRRELDLRIVDGGKR